MKAKQFQFASRLAAVVLAAVFTISFTACGSDDDNDPSIDDILSEETTPVTFALYKVGEHQLYDYAGNKLVDSHSFNIDSHLYSKDRKIKLDLRQGKHKLVWFTGLDDGVNYNPEAGMLTCTDADASLGDLEYCIKEIEVTPYLMPEQELDYASICGHLHISVDFSPSASDYELWVKDVPFVKSVSVEGNKYDMERLPFQRVVAGSYNYYDHTPEVLYVSEYVLCPQKGIENVQIMYEVRRGSSVVSSGKMPKFSLQRNYNTIIDCTLDGDGELIVDKSYMYENEY